MSTAPPVTFQSIVLDALNTLGFQTTDTSLPARLLQLFQQLEWFLLALALAFLVIIVYLKLRLAEVEHAGWHSYHAHQEEHHDETHPKNPRWSQIMGLMSSASESDWRRAVIEADIMLGQLLTERGFVGADIGEQLRGASRAHFSTLDSAWDAHRVRNQIAHEPGYQLSIRDAQSAIDNYRRVFEEFDYI